MLRGKFPFTFEGKNVPEWPKKDESDKKDEDKSEEKKKEEKKEAPQKAELKEAKDSIVLVIGSGDFAKDVYYEQYDRRLYLGDYIFLRNVVEAFTLGEELIAIRAKQSARRPLDPNVDPLTKDLLKWINVLGVPLLVALAGIIYATFRSRSTAAFERRVAVESQKSQQSNNQS